MQKRALKMLLLLCFLISLVGNTVLGVEGLRGHQHSEEEWVSAGRLVKEEQRKEIVRTEFGNISAVDVDDGIGEGWEGEGRKKYHLQFISLDPNSLFLPSILHADMVFYVDTGSGRLSYTEEGRHLKEVKLRKGDVYGLKSGSIFYIQSNLETERERFRINAIFSNADEELQEEWVGAYTGIHELFQGFDKRILQAAFQVSEEDIEEIINATRKPQIVHAGSTEKRDLWETETGFVKAFLGIKRLGIDLEVKTNKKKLKHNTKAFNIFKEKRDVENCNGWSTMVTAKDHHALESSNIGVFMVNLRTSAMMGPHWNPIATEIAVVLEGRGMVRVVCSSHLSRPECKDTNFMIEQGDVFVVPRYHPMAQMSFNNETLVFMGFSTSNRNNHPQFLAGKASVLRVLSKRVLELSFNVNSTVVSKLLAAQKDSVILDCVSCAEEEEEAGRREEKERRRREEEERRRREKEEERRRQEEEQKEKERRQQEEEQKEEERRRQEAEEERRQQEEEEERRRHEQEETEEEAARREEEERERERRRRREEERRRRQGRGQEEEREETEEEAARREEEEREREWHQPGRQEARDVYLRKTRASKQGGPKQIISNRATRRGQYGGRKQSLKSTA